MENHTRSDELYHYGVLGMKWGVRRYQNKDGTSTSLGKKRRRINYEEEAKGMTDDELRKSISRMNMERRYINLSKGSKASNRSNTINKASRSAENASKITRDVKKLNNIPNSKADPISKGFSVLKDSSTAYGKISNKASTKKAVKSSREKFKNMSDDELRETINRMDLERQYSSLKREQISIGKTTAMDVLDVAGDILQVGASAAALAVSISLLKKGKGIL